MDSSEPRRAIVRLQGIPKDFPTHKHRPLFWEWLGRAIATFGFLEETLGKAIFSMTGTKPINEEDVEAEFEKWLPKLERALSDPLGGLIDAYASAVRAHPRSTITNLDELVEDLRKASVIRNVLCHGSWGAPDASGFTIPFFVNKRKEVFQGAIDVAYLQQVQRHVTELSVAVINSVTHMGWQFPGSSGPGRQIWPFHETDR